MIKNLIIHGIIIMFIFSVFPAYAEIITFESAPSATTILNTGEYTFKNPFYEEGYLYPLYDPDCDCTTNSLYLPGFSDGVLDIDGYSFTGDHFHTVDYPGLMHPYDGFPDNGTIYLSPEGGGSSETYITMTSSTDTPFSLISFDAAEAFVDVEAAAQDSMHFLVANSIDVTGKTVDGYELFTSFVLDGINDGVGGTDDFEAFVFSSDWVNLTSVIFYGYYSDTESGGYSLDNINVMPSVVPEPVSTILFIVGGATLGIRRLWR